MPTSSEPAECPFRFGVVSLAPVYGWHPLSPSTRPSRARAEMAARRLNARKTQNEEGTRLLVSFHDAIGLAFDGILIGFIFGTIFCGFSKSEILAMIPVSFNRCSSGQTLSSRTKSASIALREASKNVAENVPRLILFAMLASVSCKPCFLSRSASSRYPTSARANSALRNRFARCSQEGDFVVIGILSHLDNTYHIR